MTDNVFNRFDVPRPKVSTSAPASAAGNVFNRFDAPASSAGMPKAVADFAAQIQRPTPTPDAGGYGVLDLPKELASGALKGTGSLVGGIGDLGRLIARPIVGGVNAIAGRDVLSEPENAFERPAAAISGLGDTIADTETEGAKAAKARPIVTGDITRPSTLSLGEGASSPMSLAMGAAGLAGQAVPLLAGGLEARGAKLTAEAAEALPGIVAKVRGGQTLTGTERAIADQAAAATKAAGRRAVGTGAAIGGLQGAEGAAEAERARVEQMPDEDLAQVPGYQQRVAAGVAPADARAEVARDAGEGAFATTLPVAAAAGVVSTAPLLQQTQGVLARVAGEAMARRAVVGAALEAPTQAVLGVAQNAAQIAGANNATGEQRDVGENSAAAAGAGAALGAGFGAVGAVAHRSATALPHPDAAPGSLSDAANAIHEAGHPRGAAPASDFIGDAQGNVADARAAVQAPANGESVPAPADRGLPGDSLAPAPVDETAPSSAGEPAATDSAAAAPVEVAPAPPRIPWFDEATGELRKPTDNEVKDQFHLMFDQAMAEGLGVGATKLSRHQAATWGLTFADAKRLRADALAERNEGFKLGDERAAPPEPEGTAAASAETHPSAAPNEEVPHAPEAGIQPQGDHQQHTNGDRGGQTAEAGGGDRIERGTPEQPAGGAVEAARQDEVAAVVPAAATAHEQPAAAAAEVGPPPRAAEGDRVTIATGEHAGKTGAVMRAGEHSTGVRFDDGRQASVRAGDVAPAAAESEGSVAPAAVQSEAKPVGAVVEAAARESAAHPEAERPATPAQQEAGNHKMGHVNVHGMDVTIEVPKGGMRRGTSRDGTQWEREASDHYGYIKRTEAADGEQVDVYLGPHAEQADAKVFVIDQVKPGTRAYDESKAMIGFADGRSARRSYEANFPKGLKTFGGIREMSIGEFKTWVKDGSAKKPATDKVDLPLPTQRKGERRTKSQLTQAFAEQRAAARERVMGEKEVDPAAVRQMFGDQPLSRQRALEALRELRGDPTLTADDLAYVPSKREGKSQTFDAADVVRAARVAKGIERDAAGFRQPAPGAAEAPDKGLKHTAAVATAVRDVVKGWGENAPSVRVLDSPEKLPASAREHTNYRWARGYYFGNTVYIVAPNHASPDSALRTLAHEVVGHVGINHIVDEHVAGGWERMQRDFDRLFTDESLGSRDLRAVLQDVQRRYPNADSFTRASEALAIMAERGMRNGLIGRAIAAVRTYLRKLMPNLRFTDADLRAMLAKSDEFIRAGTPLEQRQAAVRALAFSMPDAREAAPESGAHGDGVGTGSFSMPDASMSALDDVLAKPDESLLDRAKAWMRGKVEDLRPAALGALQTRHILELAEQHPALRGAKRYGDQMQLLAADRNQLMAGAPDAAEHPGDMLKRGGARIAEDLRKFTYERGPAGWFGRRRPEAKQLFDVMHDATLYGLDPSEPYQRLAMEDSKGDSSPWTKEAVKERIAAIRGQMRGRPGDDKTMMMEEVKRLRGLPARERLREQRWPELVARWQGMPEEGKALYRQMRDWHTQMRDETEKALIARINALSSEGLGKNYVRSLQDRIRLQFEAQRREGVYFPLNRDGDFWVSFTDKNGEAGFKMFESARDASAAERKLRAAGYRIEAQGRRDGDYKAKDAPPGTFVRDVVQLLSKAGASEKLQNDVYQMFLKTLPEMSMRKHSIQRKGIPGFSDDALRAFAKNSFHGAHQLARLRHAHEMQATIEAMEMAMDGYRRSDEVGKASASSALDVARGDALLGEMKRRHDYIMSPKDSQLANVANSIGFINYLGLSPASALVNLTQNAQVTLPVMGAHHGWGKASRTLGAALRDALRTGGNIDRTLTSPEERQAYNVLRMRGDIDKTQSHTLAGLAEGSLVQSSPAWARSMQAISYLFHKAEVVNREAAGMAAYRLARAGGDSFEKSVAYASDIINGTHFDYSAANRPRIMQGNAARVALQFKNYSVGMTWMLYRNLYQAMKGETPEVRSVARKTLTGILGTTALMAGTMGLPVMNLLRAGGNAAHALFGDDEPFDFDTEYRKWLGDHLGADAAKWVADGAVNRLGANVSGRVGLADLWFREPDKELEGKDAYYQLLESLVGPIGGMVKNYYVGAQMVGDGQVARGVETMLPKFAKDAMKATRFAHEGANTLRGDPIVPDITGPEAFAQAIGFQPTRLFEQQKTNSALKRYEQAILDRRQTLMNAYAMAMRAGDDRDVAMEKIHAFNQQYPEIAIKSDSLRQSLRARARYSAQADGGISLNKHLAPRLREAVGTPAGATQ